MKRFLLVLGLVFAVLIVLEVAGIAIAIGKGMALNEEGKAYADEVAPKILADLRKETLLAYASDDFKNTVKTEEMDKIFAWFQKPGRFKEYKDSAGHVLDDARRQGHHRPLCGAGGVRLRTRRGSGGRREEGRRVVRGHTSTPSASSEDSVCRCHPSQPSHKLSLPTTLRQSEY